MHSNLLMRKVWHYAHIFYAFFVTLDNPLLHEKQRNIRLNIPLPALSVKMLTPWQLTSLENVKHAMKHVGINHLLAKLDYDGGKKNYLLLYLEYIP